MCNVCFSKDRLPNLRYCSRIMAFRYSIFLSSLPSLLATERASDKSQSYKYASRLCVIMAVSHGGIHS